MPRIFICYRRRDSDPWAQHVYTALTSHFGSDSVVFDVDSVPLGADFRRYLDDQVSRCDMLLAVIGDKWLTLLDEHPEDKPDYVRIEIEAALKRDIPVVPVLVGEASIPEASSLPEDIKDLAFRNEAEVRGGRDLHPHLDRLIRLLERLLPAKAHLEPGEIFRDTLADGSEGPEMVVIPAGGFSMGDTQGDGAKLLLRRMRMGAPVVMGLGEQADLPVHRVHIERPFAMGRYSVTFEEYDRFAKVTGRELPEDQGWGRDQRPVINVSWKDAVAYTEWLSQQTGKRYRLPSEAEWEYAARADTVTTYWWGNEMKTRMANCYGCGSQWDNRQTAPVGSFAANPFGLHDTAGNVREWVQDCSHKNYTGAPKDGSAWQDADDGDCDWRVIRGGSWGSGSEDVRSAYRDASYADCWFNDVGFRIAQDLD